MYEEGEKPKFPTDYVKKHLKNTTGGSNEVILINNRLREENKRLKQKVTDLERQLDKLQKDLEKL